jgi:rhomboid family protein
MRQPGRRQGIPGRAGRWSITTTLIVANIAVFLIHGMAGVADPGPSPESLTFGNWIWLWLYDHPVDVMERFCFWQPLTSAFLHADFGHLFFNMLFLFFFGRDLEKRYGRNDFLWFYLLACYVGGLAYAVGGYFYTGAAVPAIGASSGVMGVVVLFALIYPRQQVYVFLMFPVEIWILAVLYVVGDLAGFLNHSSSGVANAAHLGGAAVGLLFRYYDLRWTTLTRSLRGRRRSAPRRRAQPDEPSIIKFQPRRAPRKAAPPDAAPDSDKQRMDDILTRISRDGMESLSEKEKDFLAKMSRKLRDR